MALVTVDNPEIFSVSIAQSPGLIAPAINVQIMPHLAQVQASWFQYEAPELQITVGGVAYSCLPQETSVEIDPDNLGVGIEVQYYPETLVKLQNLGLKKNIVFLSCPDYERNILGEEYDDEHYEILHKDCDVYCSNGWEIGAIISVLGGRAGIPISVNVPPFHVPNPTIVFKRGQKILPFIRSLLPGDFEYAWALTQGGLTVTLIEPPPGDGEVAFIDGMYRMVVTKSSVPAYDFVEIKGGRYKWGTRVDLGEANRWGGSFSYYPDGKQVTEQLPEEVKDTTDGQETYYVSRTFKTGPEGEKLFSLLDRKTEVIGPYLQVIEPPQFITTATRETTEVFEYENDDPMIYLQPRQTRVLVESKLFHTHITNGKTSGQYQTFWLTEDSRVLTPDEYNDIPTAEQPEVILAAWHVYGLAETTEETFTWTTTENADKNWFEGTQRDNTIKVEHRFVRVNGVYYDSLLSPKELCQQVLADLVTADIEDPEVDTFVNGAWRTAEINTKKVTLLNEGSFQLEQAQSVFDTKVGSMTQKVSKQAINGRPPGNPSKYRTEQLIASLEAQGSGGGSSFQNVGGDTCVPFLAQIDTNNPEDFELWAGMLWGQVSTVNRRASMASFDRLLGMGFSYGGITMNSFQASQLEGGAQTVVMGGL